MTRAAAVVLLVLAGVFVAPVAWAADLTGTVIVLDAGHGAAADGPLTRQVPNGRGGTKDCQTTGTSTDGGYPEHTFNWDVVARVQAELNARGATTYLTRTDDSGPAPCVDARAAYANAQHPNAIISIHADGGPPSGHGFHVNYSAPPLNDVQAGDAVRLANTMHDALVAAGFAESTYLGSGGLYGRADLAGLNLAEYPSVLVELGNMRNADDAALMTTDEGRARYAAAVAQGVASFVTPGV